jgi:hypothetical protein
MESKSDGGEYVVGRVRGVQDKSDEGEEGCDCVEDVEDEMEVRSRDGWVTQERDTGIQLYRYISSEQYNERGRDVLTQPQYLLSP